ncbi:hypothetical protein ACE1TI_20975 [Alteribacillus sp. JSM 102045]|uniref:hypothetical protein n=1 Tax=Alteribacillus sp. JSM 102045 TaxID=1562101 RepID=UPI0035C236BC
MGMLLLLFVVSITVVRFMGKSALAQFTPHDLTAIFFIVAIAMAPVKVEGITQALIGIAIVVFVHVSLSKLSLYNQLNRFIIGEPTILIKHGKLIKSNLKKIIFLCLNYCQALEAKAIQIYKTFNMRFLNPMGILV